MKNKILLISFLIILGSFFPKNTTQAVYGSPPHDKIELNDLTAKIDAFDRALVIKLKVLDPEIGCANQVSIKAMKNLDDCLSSPKSEKEFGDQCSAGAAADAKKSFDDLFYSSEIGVEFINQSVVNTAMECDDFFLNPEILNRNSFAETDLRETLRNTNVLKLFHVLFHLTSVSENALGYVLKTFSQAYPEALSDSFSYLTEYIAKNPSEVSLSIFGKGLSVLGRTFYHKVPINHEFICSSLNYLSRYEESFLVQALSILLSGEETREEEENFRIFFDFTYAFNALKIFSKMVKLEDLEKIETHPQCFAMILEALESSIFNAELEEQKNQKKLGANLNYCSEFFSSVFSDSLEKSNPDVLSLALAVLLSDTQNENFDHAKANLDFVFTIFDTEIPNALPDAFVRVFKVLYLLNPRALGKALGTALDNAVDSYEAYKAKNNSLADKDFKNFRDIFAHKIIDMLFLPEKNKLLIYFSPQEFFSFSEEDVGNKGDILFYCSDKLLNFIVSSVNAVPEDEKEKIFEKIVSGPHGLNFFAKYMDLSGISFENLSKNLQEKIKLTLPLVLGGEYWGAFLKFKNLIDQKIDKDEVKDDFGVYKKFSEYLKFFNALNSEGNLFDKQNALEFFNKNFKKDKMDFLLYLMKIYDLKNYQKNVEDLKKFKMKNLKNNIKALERKQLQDLRKEEQKIDEIFLDLGLDTNEFNSNKIKEIIKKNTRIADKDLISILEICEYQELSERIEKFSFFYKNLLDPSSRIRIVFENFEPDEMLFFLKLTTEFGEDVDQEFINYLNFSYEDVRFWPFGVINGINFIICDFPKLYKVLMREFSYAVQKKKFEALILEQEKENFVLEELTSFLTYDVFAKDTNMEVAQNSSIENKEESCIFSQKLNKKFSLEYRQASIEQREQLLEDITEFCLNILNGEDFLYENCFTDFNSCKTFKENLRKGYEKYVQLHAASLSYQDRFSMQSPYARLEKFFEDAFIGGLDGGKEMEKNWKQAPSLLY
ncbi:hypothetical protein HE1_00575 [Holospora elegans E1]|uniref:Uncharacterized protein n=1 Tax=Holospora elegans E1 TaxID=1427503 RepID=A0A023DY73_9PROT|nr:hypothetical protein [Holospora elegans]GAJ46249.1 hypothetical protein HE1_00575 [Holospora elegans E1]